MNALTTQSDTTSIRSVGVTSGASGTSLAPQNLGDVVRFAEVMAKADIALPKHLRQNPGACMAVAMQALEWGMSPFAVASKSYSVNGTIAYEAQLVAAVVNTRSGIKGRLRYAYTGEGGSLQCTVTGSLDGEDFSYTSPRFDQITTKNSPLWKSDPQQQLGYFAARSWARRYVPEVLLGVYDRDEVEGFGPDNARDVTPAAPGIAARLSKPADGPREGFNGTMQFESPAPLPSAAADEPETALFGSGVTDDPQSGDAINSAPTSSPVADQGGTGNSSQPVPPASLSMSADEPRARSAALAKQALAIVLADGASADMAEIDRLLVVCRNLAASDLVDMGCSKYEASTRAKLIVKQAKSILEDGADPKEVTAYLGSVIGEDLA